MAILNIEGYSPITVDDEFLNFSPERREEEIDSIVADLESKGVKRDSNKTIQNEETSGWGETIGSTLGGIGGAAAGFVTSPSLIANPVTLSVAGSGLGGGIGETIEQAWTGKGNPEDITDAAKEGALWGLLPGGVGGAAKGVTKIGAKVAGKTTGKTKNLAKGAVDTVKENRVVQGIMRHSGVDRAVDSAVDVIKKPGEDYASGMIKVATGRIAAGTMQMAQAKLDVARNVIGYFKTNLNKLLNSKGKVVDDDVITAKATELAKKTLADNKDYKAFVKNQTDEFDIDALIAQGVKPKVRSFNYKGVDVFEDEFGTWYNAKTGKQLGDIYWNEGGKVEDKRKNKLRKLHAEGKSSAQSFAIMKSMESRGELNMGGEVLQRYEGGGLVDPQITEDVVEGAYIPDTIVSSIPVGSYIVNAAAANHPQFKRELLEMGGKVIKNDFNPKFGKDYTEALVGLEEIYLNPHITKKHGKYIEQVNDWGRDVKKRLGT